MIVVEDLFGKDVFRLFQLERQSHVDLEVHRIPNSTARAKCEERELNAKM